LVPTKNLCVISLLSLPDAENREQTLDFIEKYVKKTHPEINLLYLHVFKHKNSMKEFYENSGFQIFYESFEGFNLIKAIE
jgi:hypothetical protein